MPGIEASAPTQKCVHGISHEELARQCPLEFRDEDIRSFLQLDNRFPREDMVHRRDWGYDSASTSSADMSDTDA